MSRIRIAWTRPFVVFTLLMMLKIYLSWTVIFGTAKIATPLIASLPSIWVAFCLIELFAKKHKLAWYVIIDALFTSVYFAAIMYYQYYGVIVNYHALQQANQVVQVKASVISLMHPYFLLIYTDVVFFILLFTFYKKARSWEHARVFLSRRSMAAVLCLSLLFCITNIWLNRGIINEIKQAEQMGIINYEIYTVFADMKKDTVDPSTVTPEAIRQLKGLEEEAGKQYAGAAEGRNVIVIQLESFQNFLLGLSVDGQEVTPVLNSLMREGFYFPHIYQQVGQGNTSDAEFMLNTSFYIPLKGAASQEYANKQLPSLPKLFKEKGYTALTFHTNDVTFWNRDKLYAALGFDRYYDHAFFGDEDLLFFGPSDETLYAKTAAELAAVRDAGQKFYANVISMSSHHPYDLPAERQRITLPEEFGDTLVGNYLRAANYADYALGQFIEKLKEYSLWDQSMLFIYGDHLGLPIYALTDDEKTLLRNLLGREYGYKDMMNIPLLIAIPGVTEPKVFEQVGGHVDFMPTIANLAGLPMEGRVYFGQDLLNSTHNLLPERYYLPSGSFINNDIIFVPGIGFDDGDMYPLKAAEDVRGREEYRSDYEHALQLMKMSDSYVNHLPDR